MDIKDIKRNMATKDWLNEIERDMDDSSPYYLPAMIGEIRRLRDVSGQLAARNMTLLNKVKELVEKIEREDIG